MSRDLRNTQELFWRLVTAPEGASKALDELGLSVEQLEDVVRGDGPVGAVERMDIYANMYFFRILDILKEDFPRLYAEMGHDDFHNLITSYLIEHPSSHPSLRYIGQSLPWFIEAGYRRDLARLEWVRVEVFDAPDDEIATAAKLQSLTPEEWPLLKLEFIEAFHILELDWPVDDLWRAIKQGDSPLPELTPAPTTLRVWRQWTPGNTDTTIIKHTALSPMELASLRAFQQGADLSDVCVAAATVADNQDAAHVTAEVARFLQLWLDAGIVKE